MRVCVCVGGRGGGGVAGVVRQGSNRLLLQCFVKTKKLTCARSRLVDNIQTSMLPNLLAAGALGAGGLQHRMPYAARTSRMSATDTTQSSLTSAEPQGSEPQQSRAPNIDKTTSRSPTPTRPS